MNVALCQSEDSTYKRLSFSLISAPAVMPERGQIM